MFDEIDKRYLEIEKIAKENELNLDIIKKAYETAKRLHFNQKRKDGEPYLMHPVEVALILAKLNFDENVIAGALLHDTIEDCGYSKEEMAQDFNEMVAQLVDCVSAIDKEKYIFDKDNVFEDENFVKFSAEEQTFKKLIEIGKKNPCGFAIKFADRLHNLSTIETFAYSKQLEKVKETEKWILPIAKALNAEYFYRAIQNECFKIVNREKGKQFLEQYENYHNSNKKNVEKLLFKLKELFANTIVKEIKIKDVRQYKIFEDLCKIYKKIDISKISQGQILKVTNYNIYGICDNKIDKEIINKVLRVLNKSKLKVIDIKIGGFTNKLYFQLEDEIKNKFNFYVMSKTDYVVQKVGSSDGQNLDLIDEDNINELDLDLIKIKTRSGEVKYIQKGSTVLDFAFKLHRDLGFGFKYAIINGSKTKIPHYTKLIAGDQVEIIVDKDVNGQIQNNANIKWFAYVNTELAKRNLIKWFEKNYK